MSSNIFYKSFIYLCISKGYLLPNYHMLCIILDSGNMILGEKKISPVFMKLLFWYGINKKIKRLIIKFHDDNKCYMYK